MPKTGDTDNDRELRATTQKTEDRFLFPHERCGSQLLLSTSGSTLYPEPLNQAPGKSITIKGRYFFP